MSTVGFQGSYRGDDFLACLDRSRETRGDDGDVPSVNGLGKKRRRWRAPIEQHGREFIGHGLHIVEVELRDLLEPVPREECAAGEDDRPDRVQLEFERCHDAEVPAAAAQSPKEIRILPVVGGHELTVCRDDVGRDEVVGRVAVLSYQPRLTPASERQPGDPCRRYHAARRRESERLRLVIDVTPERSTRPR
jgi:hypothetical protein